MTLALIALAVFIGAMVQRIAGMGFAIAAAPFLVLIMGPFTGILVVNIASIVSALLVFGRLRAGVEWRAYFWLVIPALVGIVPGSWLVYSLWPAWLEVIIGLVLVLALVATRVVSHREFIVAGNSAKIIAGFLSGTMNAAAGIGGPAVSIYGLMSGWTQSQFTATLQPYFMTIGIASVGAKIVLNGGELPTIDLWVWVVVVASLIFGILVADVSAKRISSEFARRAVAALAFLGAMIAIVKGTIALIV